MKVYSASSEETLRARKFLTDWVEEGLLSKTQYEVLGKETVCDLRTTNIFLRLVLFLFTLIIVGAAAGLFFMVFLSRPDDQTFGAFLLIFGVLCYTAAEIVVYKAKLYRYGIEEALAVCSVAFLCVGIEAAFFARHSWRPDAIQCLIPFVGGLLSLWIWHRFGFSYAFLAAMIFVVFLPGYWTSSHSWQHVIIAAFYAVGLTAVAAAHSRHHFDYLDEGYSLVEAFLWLGIYLTINLQLSSFDISARWWGGVRAGSEFSRSFYWGTWVLIWCLPPIVLARGVRQKNRAVIAAGAITAFLTLVSNKPYLGWPRHTWDPMLLGILLTGLAIFIRRWLARGPDGIRHGFTAARLSGKDEQWMNVGSTVMGMLSPHPAAPAPQIKSEEFHFGGGSTGGGGSGGDF